MTWRCLTDGRQLNGQARIRSGPNLLGLDLENAAPVMMGSPCLRRLAMAVTICPVGECSPRRAEAVESDASGWNRAPTTNWPTFLPGNSRRGSKRCCVAAATMPAGTAPGRWAR